MSEWTLTREPALGEARFGLLTLGQPASVVQSLERTSVAIPEGRFRIVLTESNRAKAGTLWCPDHSMRLPLLLEVPLRTAIRIHAGNKPQDSDGCVLAGMKRAGLQLADSRPAVTKIFNLLLDAERTHDEVWLTVSAITAPVWTHVTTTQRSQA